MQSASTLGAMATRAVRSWICLKGIILGGCPSNKSGIKAAGTACLID